MGTTLDALNAGSLTYRYVVAIEGYAFLLTNGDPGDLSPAWDGSAYDVAGVRGLGGLFVELDAEGMADPWVPFQGGGTCTLRVVRTNAADTFGVDTHRKLTGAETYLAATADRNDITIHVLSTTGFAAAGEAFIGTECIAYTSLTATTFAGVTRGMYSPFQNSIGQPWAGFHRVGIAANRVNLSPIVSQQPRTWLGKWVAVYVHRVVAGVLDDLANAHCVFAGKIDDLRDDATGATVLQLRHVLDTLGETTIGRDQFSAEVAEGLFLREFITLRMFDWTSFPTASKGSHVLTVVGSGATGTDQINAGYYSLGAICEFISVWLAGELAAGNIYGSYWMASPVPSPNGLRTKLYYEIPNAGSTHVKFELQMPALLAMFLGYTDYSASFADQALRVTIAPTSSIESNTAYRREGSTLPLRTIIAHQEVNVLGRALEIGLENEVGTFVDQFADMPVTGGAPQSHGLPWGIFSFNDAGFIMAAKDGSNLRFALTVFGFLPGAPGVDPLASLVVGIDQTAPIVLKQIVAISATFATLVKKLFYSSGTLHFNHPSFDVLSYGLGANIPGSLLGPDFEASIDALPGAGASLFVYADKAMKLSEVLSSDLILRWAFPRWRQGRLGFAAWQIPTPDNAVAALTEHTKARPAATTTNDRAATVLSSELQYSIITVRYNRLSIATEDYKSFLTFEDATAVDDGGGEGKPLTIKARNVYAELVGSGPGIEQIAPDFLAQATLFTRPFRKLSLSIGPALYEQVAPGDVVTITDSFARDPTTGLRGLSARAALVIRARYNRGGAQLGNPMGVAAQGEVEVLLAPDQARIAAYAPAAELDRAADGGGFAHGYNPTTKTLRCITHQYSETTEPRDAARFANGDKILVVEIDPAVPSAPLLWFRTVNGTPVNDDIVLNTALTSPTYDGTLAYRVTFDHYATQTATQRQLCSQADDATGQIEALAAPYQFSAGTSAVAFTAYDPTLPIELIPDVSYGDGKALDVGHEAALAQLANNLVDYRTAHHSAALNNFEMVSAASGTYRLLAFYPVFLTAEVQGSVSRSLAVAPFLRSDGLFVRSVRISLCNAPPSEDNIDDVERPAGYSEAVFSTLSPGYITPAAQFLDERAKAANGIGWIWIEGTIGVHTYGLMRCDQGPRT